MVLQELASLHHPQLRATLVPTLSHGYCPIVPTDPCVSASTDYLGKLYVSLYQFQTASLAPSLCMRRAFPLLTLPPTAQPALAGVLRQ